MYRNIPLLAFGGACGFFAARGLMNCDTPSAATACRAKKSSPSSDASATPPNPQPACQRNSRRVRPQKLCGRVMADPITPNMQTHSNSGITDKTDVTLLRPKHLRLAALLP